MVGVAASTVRWMAGPERGVVVRDDKVYRSSPRMPVSQHPLVHPSPRDSGELYPFSGQDDALRQGDARDRVDDRIDRKSTRLNSSHVAISYAVFCLKKQIIIDTEGRVKRTLTYAETTQLDGH